MTDNRLIRITIWGNGLIAMGLALFFFVIPAITVARNLNDPAMQNGDIPRDAWRIHKALTPRYEEWARERVASGAAADVHYLDVPGTEWPLFGSVFFFWATENLQRAWEQDNTLAPVAPAEYARDTIDACKELLLDPAHHAFVQEHWGDDYMHQENVFFRSLLIAGLTSYENLTSADDTIDVLRDQVENLSAELDASPHGVLQDYPGECYPLDVLPAIAWIRRADAVLGTDHSAFVERSRRAFTGNALDDHGLVPWQVNHHSGKHFGRSRGITMSHVLIFAPEIYPDLAEDWMKRYIEHFWQERSWAVGFRELYRGDPRGEWAFLVDSGPLIDGFSPAGNAFGVAMARINGRMDIGYTLGAMMLTAAWPLPNGRLLGGQALSISKHAPYLGEMAILWQLTESPHENAPITTGGKTVPAVYGGFIFCFLASVATMFPFVGQVRRLQKEFTFPVAKFQFMLWATLILIALLFIFSDTTRFAVVTSLIAQLIPRGQRPAQ